MDLELQEMFDRLEENDQSHNMDFGNPDVVSVDSFNEEDHAEILDKLSLMDREGYVELLRKRHKMKKMREELVLADLDDDKSNLTRSKDIAANINTKHKKLVSEPEHKLEYDKIES